MNDKWKETFDPIRAESSLKHHTKEYLAKKVYRKKGFLFFVYHRFAFAAVCLVFVFFAGSYYLYFFPTAFISIDINPSVELRINRYNQIISVEGYNDDGRLLADALEVKFMNYLDALNQILSDQSIQAYLSDDEQMSLTVAGKDQAQCSSILQTIESFVSNHKNIHCHAGNADEIHTAHALGMSFGKYQAFLVLQELEPSFTADEVKDLSMKEIKAFIEKYSKTDESSPSDATDTTEGSENQRQRHRHRYGQNRSEN